MIKDTGDQGYDFKKILINCIMCFDSDYETAVNRANDWLWLTKNNHKIGEFDPDEDDIESVLVFTDILNQISEFTDINDKKCMCYYLIVTNQSNNGMIELRENLSQDELNLQNKEVNAFISNIRTRWNTYDQALLDSQNRMFEKILGSDIMEYLRLNAPAALSNIQIGPMNKQLIGHGFNNMSNWSEISKQLTDIKAAYRTQMNNKEETVWNEFMKDKLAYWEYKNKIPKLKDAIKSNLETLGGANDATGE